MRQAAYECPVPYSATFCATRMGWEGQAGRKRANRITRALVEAGTIHRYRWDLQGQTHGRAMALYFEPALLPTFGNPQVPVDFGIAAQDDEFIQGQSLAVKSSVDEPASKVAL